MAHKGQSISEALSDVIGDIQINKVIGVSELPLPKEEPEQPNDIGIVEQNNEVSLDFVPGQPTGGEVRKYGPSKKDIVGRKSPGLYKEEELIQSEGEMWCSYDLTYTDTVVHEEYLHDELTGKRFRSKSVILEADNGNTSDIQFKFNPTGSYDTISAGKQFSLDGRRISKILVKLGTSGDKLYLKAW